MARGYTYSIETDKHGSHWAAAWLDGDLVLAAHVSSTDADPVLEVNSGMPVMRVLDAQKVRRWLLGETS